MRYTAGIDIGSTYTKALLLDEHHVIVGRALLRTGFQLQKAAETAYRQSITAAGLTRGNFGPAPKS